MLLKQGSKMDLHNSASTQKKDIHLPKDFQYEHRVIENISIEKGGKLMSILE